MIPADPTDAELRADLDAIAATDRALLADLDAIDADGAATLDLLAELDEPYPTTGRTT